MQITTKIVQAGLVTDKTTGAISTPIYQTATFRHPALGESTGYDYSRTKNPTRQAVEIAIATLEEGDAGYAFASGMAAITAIAMLYGSGAHLIITEDCYGGTYRVFEKIFKQFGLQVSYVNTADVQAVRSAITGDTRAIFLETPTNPLMKIADIQALVALAKEHQLQTIVDNTFLTPYLQKPLSLGADIVIHSGSKYLAGHNDVICGLIVAKGAELCSKLAFIQNSTGMILGPQDSWLLLRGIKTLAVRLDRQQENTLIIAQWLEKQKWVNKVYYPGLESSPQKELQNRQASGYGAMLSFEVCDAKLVPQILQRLKLIQFAESLGGVESLITFPFVQTHADIPLEIRLKLGVNEQLLRFSVGIESVTDLIEDLQQAVVHEIS
ncbi:trans-sulfuration enzyme family protein [Succinispira mobilis]|uniref:trans-sulfuration enzyme family protein n=1 Tax=Succinispira mobilis TaxID=78120 RepID=UPI0003609EA1|nr:aminotransferase class I/II-fold pyridoxal phosphate-dependent enzyme [Succinispira mobilis]